MLQVENFVFQVGIKIFLITKFVFWLNIKNSFFGGGGGGKKYFWEEISLFVCARSQQYPLLLLQRVVFLVILFVLYSHNKFGTSSIVCNMCHSSSIIICWESSSRKHKIQYVYHSKNVLVKYSYSSKVLQFFFNLECWSQ